MVLEQSTAEKIIDGRLNSINKLLWNKVENTNVYELIDALYYILMENNDGVWRS